MFHTKKELTSALHQAQGALILAERQLSHAIGTLRSFAEQCQMQEDLEEIKLALRVCNNALSDHGHGEKN